MNLYVDFDDTLVNSSDVVVDILNKRYKMRMDCKGYRKYNFTDLFPKLTKEELKEIFESDEFFNSLKIYEDCLSTLLSFYSKTKQPTTFVTHGTDINLYKKEKYLDISPIEFQYTFIGLSNEKDKNEFSNFKSKKSVDMKNGIFIDDNIKNLKESNASIKILFKDWKEKECNKLEPNSDIYVLNSWYEINEFISFILRNNRESADIWQTF